jgi:lipopolysaccharide exporter
LQRFSLTLFGLVSFIILIRKLPKEYMGVWALFLTVTGIFEAVKTNLLKNAHIKYATATTDREEKIAIASSSFIINTIISAGFILFLLAFAKGLSLWLQNGTELGSMLLWFIPGIIFMIFFTHLESVQQSNLDFKGVFAGYFVRQALFFGVIVIHLFLDLDFTLVQLALYQSASIFFGTLVLFFFTKKYLGFHFRPQMVWMKKIIGYGGYIFGSGTVAHIYQNLDQLMIAKFMSPVSVASYNAASRINQLVDIPSYAASEILFPKASQASAEEGTARVKYLYEKMVAILLTFTIPVAVFILIFPKFVITLIAGTDYLEAAPILQLYMITGMLRPAQNQAANLLNSIGKPRLCFFMNTGYLAVNLVANYICLVRFGFYGAAIGTLITFSIGAVAWYFVMKKQIGFEPKNIGSHALEIMKTVHAMIMQKFRKNIEPAKP